MDITFTTAMLYVTIIPSEPAHLYTHSQGDTPFPEVTNP